MTQNFYFDIQRFATGTAVKIGGVVNNVEVGDTFTVEGAKYTVLAVEKNSVTALVDGTPAENLGKQIVIGDGKSIDGVTYQTTALEDADSEISTKYTYKLDIGGNPVFVTVFDNAIESVADSDGNALSASGDDYTVNGKNFSLSLVDGIPQADYTVTNSVATTLDKVTYSFSVDSKPVEVVVKNDAISSVTVDSKQVGTKAGTYSVGEKSLKVSYADGNFSAETAAPVSTSIISSVATYQVGDTKVTVTDGNLSQTTAKVNGHNAKLTYSADTKKITATYTIRTTSTTTTGDPNLYHVTLPDNSTVDVTIANGNISAVTYKGEKITAQNGTYSVTNGTTKYNLKLEYSNNSLMATETATISTSELEKVYTVKVGSGDSAPSTTIKVTTQGSTVNLYQGDSTSALTDDDDGIYTATVGSTKVRLTYDDTDGLKQYKVDLSKLTGDYTAQDGDYLTGTTSTYAISIADGATVTLDGVTITNSNGSGITCLGNATINLVNENNVTGSRAGIQAGDTGTTLTIKGTGSLTATGGVYDNYKGSAGIGSGSDGTCGNIVIESGYITAQGGNGGAGIGSGYGSSTCGNITISDGTVKATGGNSGAGIGSGYGSNISGNITISGGDITAQGGNASTGIGAGDSGNCGDITISGGNINAKGGDGGAGIGVGYSGATKQCGDIKISGGYITAQGGGGGAGIGASFVNNGTNIVRSIEISGGTVTATGGSDGAGIGAGQASGEYGKSTCGTVTIKGTDYASGYTDDGTITGDNVVDLSTLTDSDVAGGVYTVATGKILTGTTSTYKISIAEGATVTLSGVTITGNGAAGITCAGTATIVLEGKNEVKGAENFAGIQAGGTGTLTIKGSGTLNATGGQNGAGIGSSDSGTCGDIVIESGDITATSGGNGPGIGAGGNGICGDIEIKGGTVNATGGQNGAGIGTGNGTCGAITISDGEVTATGGNNGAGIGTGNGTCGAITISDGEVTATGDNNGAGIGTGNGTCDSITISGGTVNATGGNDGAGIGTGEKGTCGNIIIENGVTSVTATKGETAINSIGKGTDSGTVGGSVIIGEMMGEKSDTTYTYPGNCNVSDPTATQTFTVNDTKITFTTTTQDTTTTTTYKIDGSTADAKTITNNGTITVDGKEYTVTISDGTVTSLESAETETLTPENDQKTVTTSSTRTVTPTFDATQTIYTFAVNGENVSVAVDSSGNMTYDGQAVTDNKITVGGVEVTLNVSDNEITGASYLGKYSPVTDIEQVDVYKATIDGQSVSLIFDENNQCTVEVNGKNYLLTKTAGGATFTSEVEKTGVEDSRIYLLEVGGERYWIGCTFDAKGNLTAVTSDDKNLSIDGTTIKIGDYTVEVGGTKDALKTSATLTVYGEGVKDVEVNQLFVLSGVKTTDGITVKNNIVTLTAANLNGQDVTIDGDGYTLALDKNYSPTETTGEHFEGNVYKSASMTDGYEISDDAKSISYVSEIPATDLFTLSGIKSTDGITVENGIVTLTAANLNGEDIEISVDGYTLQLAEGIAEPTFDEGGWTLSGTTATYKSENNTDGYTLSDDKKIVTYTAANDPEISLKVYGVKSLDGLSLDGTTVTVAASSLDKQTVTISDGYTLALAEGIKAPTFDEGGWTLSGTTATYTNASNTDGYEISDDAKSISYVAEVPATDLFVLSGVKTTDGITVKNNIVTLTAANLNNQDAKIEGDGYTLALAEGIKAPTFDEGGWTLSGTTATYTNASNTDDYEISDDAKSISYVAEVPATDLFVLSGVKTTDGITVKNNIVTLTAANLNGQDVKISGDGYTLQLADGIKAPTFDEGGWTLSGTTATYKSESNTDGYTLAGDKKIVTYTPAHDADISLKVYGVKSLDGLSLDGTTVTVAASSLDKQTVTISKGYTLAIADDVEQPSTRGKYWTQLDEDTYLYTGSSTTAGYTLKNNKITYSDESVSGEQYTIKGAAGTELISETDDTEDVEEDSLSRRKVVLIETDEHNPENNLDFYTENYAQVKIASGQDSLITYDGARSKVDMADADNVTVVSFDGQVQLDNYDVESGAVVLVQDINDIIDAIKTNKIKLVGNEIWINFSSRVAINNPNNDSTVVELVNYDGEKQLVGFTGKNGGTLDMSEFNENAVLKGNYSENSPETKYIGSTLKGGKNNDTLLAGSRDYVDGGEGQNEIYLTPYEMRYKKDGATVVSGGNSRNTVYNFHEGFGYDGDYVQVENLSDVEFKFENDGLSIASENARLKLKGIGVNSSSADAVSDFGTENPELILLTDGQTTLQSAIAKTDESILVTEKDGLKPNAFFGKRSGLNFSEYGGTVEVNLADGTGALGGRDAIFSGINKIQAGDGISRLIGSDETNTLIAGNGYGSLAGSAGDDELFGRSGSADKAGRTEFLYFEGDGRDVIYDFEFLTAENKNSGTADKIGVDTLVTKISCSGNDVVLQMNYSDENLTIKNAAGKTFQINDLVLKVDKNIVYDGLANLYIADGGDLVSVDSSVESAEIWLDNSRKTAFVGEIKTLDASAVDGKTSLAGNAFDNTIIAGNGDSSLWGGDFGNDLLIGGGGKNTFFYNFGNGNDTIQNAKAGDVVDLTNITLEQISAENITDSGVELEFIDGGTLTVNGTDCEYRVAGTSYVVDNGKWKIK